LVAIEVVEVLLDLLGIGELEVELLGLECPGGDIDLGNQFLDHVAQIGPAEDHDLLDRSRAGQNAGGQCVPGCRAAPPRSGWHFRVSA
jgi:hypothetical protein